MVISIKCKILAGNVWNTKRKNECSLTCDNDLKKNPKPSLVSTKTGLFNIHYLFRKKQLNTIGKSYKNRWRRNNRRGWKKRKAMVTNKRPALVLESDLKNRWIKFILESNYHLYLAFEQNDIEMMNISISIQMMGNSFTSTIFSGR